MAFFSKIFPGDENQSKYDRDSAKNKKNGGQVVNIPIKGEDESGAPASNHPVAKNPFIIGESFATPGPATDEKKQSGNLKTDLIEIIQKSSSFADDFASRLDEVVKSVGFSDQQKLAINDKLVAIFDPFWDFIERYEGGEESQGILDGLKKSMEEADLFLSGLPGLKVEMEKGIGRVEEKQTNGKLFESLKVEIENIFDSLDEKIDQLVPGQNELIAEEYFLGELNKIGLDGLIGQDLEAIKEMIEGARIEISYRWKAKEAEYAKYEKNLRAGSIKKKVKVEKDTEVKKKEADEGPNISIENVEDGEQKKEKSKNELIAEKFRAAATKVARTSLSKKEYEKQKKVKLQTEIEEGDLEENLSRCADIIEGHHEDSLSKNEHEEFWKKFAYFTELIEKMNDPEYLKRIIIVEGRTYIIEKQSDDEVAKEKEGVVLIEKGSSELSSLAEQIRIRVHYIDKNDFAKKAVSNKDKVYDFDLRKDLAYFVANGQLPFEDDSDLNEEKNKKRYRKFELLIKDAIDDDGIEYLVYGENTYIAKKIGNEKVRSTEKGKNVTAGLSEKMIGIFRKSAAEFVKNLKNDNEIKTVEKITEEEKLLLMKIYTKRFLREKIAEKESVMIQKMGFVPSQSEELIEAICESVF